VPTHYDLLIVLGPTKAELSVPEWGFICLYRPGDVVAVLERCFCMRWQTGQEERVCVVPLHEGQWHMSEGLSSQLAQGEDYLSLVGK